MHQTVQCLVRSDIVRHQEEALRFWRRSAMRFRHQGHFYIAQAGAATQDMFEAGALPGHRLCQCSARGGAEVFAQHLGDMATDQTGRFHTEPGAMRLIGEQVALPGIELGHQGGRGVADRAQARFAFGQPFGRYVALGHILDLRDEMHWRTAAVAHQRQRQLRPDHRALLADVALAQAVTVAFAVDQVLHQLQIHFHIIGMGDLLEVRAQQLLARIAQDAAQRRIDVAPLPFQRDDCHALWRGFECTGEALGGQLRGGLRLQFGGDVDGHCQIPGQALLRVMDDVETQAHAT